MPPASRRSRKALGKKSVLQSLDETALANFAKRKHMTETAHEQPVTPSDHPDSSRAHADSDADEDTKEAQISGASTCLLIKP